MLDAITDVPGIEVGHAEDRAGGTGCTVVLARAGAVAAGDVRGGAPATRETDLLRPENSVERVHAVYLGGGSAFGLAGATGVVEYLEQQGIGFDVGSTHVPIVPGACIFDLTVGDFRVRPDAAMGRRACLQAGSGAVAQGNHGAGTGAGVGPKAAVPRMVKGGVGTASRVVGDLVVGAIVVVNCFGDVIDPSTGQIVAGQLDESGRSFAGAMRVLESMPAGAGSLSSNTTIGVVATNVCLTKAQARRVAIMAHDGYGRSIVPAHTMWDGDSLFCLSTGELQADLTIVGAIAAAVVARAVLNAVLNAESCYGIPCCREIRERR
jgi:L-aminopeptidase/D-esterase-like protein